MKKRVFSAALAGCMMLTMVPVTAFAAEEGVTEVSIEQYAAEAATIERIDLDGINKVDFTGTGKVLGDFVNKSDELLPVANFTWFYGGDTTTAKASRSGYYLPVLIRIPGATSGATVKIKDGEAYVPNDPDMRRDKTLTVTSFENPDTYTADGEGRIGLLIQVARLDGEIFDRKFVAEIDPDGAGTLAEATTVTLDYSDVKLVPSKFMTAKAEIYTKDDKTFIGGKHASDLYDASTQTVKYIDNYTDFSSHEEMQKGYYLPLYVELDVCDDTVVVTSGGKAPNGTAYDPVVTTVNDGWVTWTQRIADKDGNLLADEVTMTIYPQGKDDAGALPSKTITVNVSDIQLEKDTTTLGVASVDPNKVTANTGAYYLQYRNNLQQVKSMELKNNVLTITANKSSLIKTDAAADASAKFQIPVFFTATKDGKSVVTVTDSAEALKYGGTSKVHKVELINLRPTADSDKEVTLYGQKIKIVVLDASEVPVLADSTVSVENGEMTGLTAQQSAKTAADIKAMYTANGGSVVIKNATGTRTLRDTDRVGTGCVIILNDKSGNPVGDPITVIVKGDVTGEGYAHLGQVVAAGRALVGTDTLEGAFLAAGDINGNGSIDLGDIVGIGQIVVGAN